MGLCTSGKPHEYKENGHFERCPLYFDNLDNDSTGEIETVLGVMLNRYSFAPFTILVRYIMDMCVYVRKLLYRIRNSGIFLPVAVKRISCHGCG